MAPSLGEVADLCREALVVADAVDARGGPPAARADQFRHARNVVEGTLAEIENDGLGIAPLVALYWVLGAVGVITAVAVAPTFIRGTTRVVETVGEQTSAIAEAVGNITRIGGYAALAIAAAFATRLALKHSA